MEQQIGKIAYVDGGMRFPLNIDVVDGVRFGARGYSGVLYNDGDTPAPVDVTISGPAVNPEVRKMETGNTFGCAGSFMRGHASHQHGPLYDMDVSITRASGMVEPAFGYLDLTSTFFRLDPGRTSCSIFLRMTTLRAESLFPAIRDTEVYDAYALRGG